MLPVIGYPLLILAATHLQMPMPGVGFEQATTSSAVDDFAITNMVIMQVSYNLVAILFTSTGGTILLASLILRGSDRRGLIFASTCAIIAVGVVFPFPYGIAAAARIGSIVVRRRDFFGSKPS